MGYRLSKITTKTGDDGTTQVEAGKRLSKEDPRIHALGDLDELNSTLGIVLAHPIDPPHIRAILLHIQQDLFNLGGELCPPYRSAITEATTQLLEENITQWNETLRPLTEFILPGGNVSVAFCHLARSICRRAERSLVHLHNQEPFNPEILRYINRLSDLLFVVARILARETQSQEILWEHARKK